MSCPNCGAYRGCLCTWEQKRLAMEILRRRREEYLRKIGQPTVIQQEADRQRRKAGAK